MGNCFRKDYPGLKDCEKFELRGTYKARLVKIYDGDTHTYVINYNQNDKSCLNLPKYGVFNIRVLGIDTPEIKTKNPIEKTRALLARDRAFELLTSVAIIGKNLSNKDLLKILNDNKYYVTLFCEKNDKYGRTLANVKTNKGFDLGMILIAEKLAVPYFGGHKPEFAC